MKPGGRWALAHAGSGWYAHLRMAGACSPLAVARRRGPEDLLGRDGSYWTPIRRKASQTSSAFYSQRRTATAAISDMRALPHGRSASLSRPATSSGRLSEQSHEFRNLNNGVNPLPPGLTAPPACPGSAPGWDSPGPTLAPGGHSLPGVGQVTGQRCGCAADTYGQWTASTM